MYRATKETLYLNRALKFALAYFDQKYTKFLSTPDQYDNYLNKLGNN